MPAKAQKQVNIRSDRAYETAHRLARRLGKSTQQIVIEALEEKARAVGQAEPEFTPEEIARRCAAIEAAIDELWGGKPPPPVDPHADDWMYDENGLPK